MAMLKLTDTKTTQPARHRKERLLPSCRAALLATAFALVANVNAMPAAAGIIGADRGTPSDTAIGTVTNKPADGLRLLKAQMNALRDGLDNLKQLKQFFDSENTDADAIIRNAERLIKSLPETEAAGEAAWRIAAVASLASKAGALSSLKINDDYRLPNGAVGWDFGGNGSTVHRGFTPIKPDTASTESGKAGKPVSGTTALTDGIVAPNLFQSSLPNGMYRVMIVANADDGDAENTNPFGGEITVNGDPVGGNALSDSASLEDRNLGASDGDRVASAAGNVFRTTALGLGVETWAIVQDGRLEIDFKGLPAGRAISAVIAEPIDLDRLELTSAMADALSTALSGLAPAAGPDSGRAGFRRGAGGNPAAGRQGGFSGPVASASPVSFTAPKPARRAAPTPVTRNRFIRSFNDIRRNPDRTTPPPVQTAASAPQETVPQPTETAEPVVQEVAETDDFFDREIIIDNNSDGLAIDLEDLLDNGSDTGTFLCTEAPCEADIFTVISEEPDLAAAIAALGDWLDDPENLTEGWQDVAAVLETWTEGSEIAAIYEFDINVDL